MTQVRVDLIRWDVSHSESSSSSCGASSVWLPSPGRGGCLCPSVTTGELQDEALGKAPHQEGLGAAVGREQTGALTLS